MNFIAVCEGDAGNKLPDAILADCIGAAADRQSRLLRNGKHPEEDGSER
jgi:hypothetical protein